MKGIVQLRQRSTEELKNRLNEICNDLLRARGWQHGQAVKTPQMDNPMFLRKLGREKAQILTILHEREAKNERGGKR